MASEIAAGDPRVSDGVSSNLYSLDLSGDIKARLELLETKIEALPGIVVEEFLGALQEFSSNCPAAHGIPLDGYGNTLRDQYGGEAKPSVQVSLREVFEKFSFSMQSNLRSSVNFDELNRLRDRVRELEEDLGYRRKVAERLMEEPHGNRRS